MIEIQQAGGQASVRQNQCRKGGEDWIWKPCLISRQAISPFFARIRTLCLSFPGTNERISHGAPCFFINDKLSFVQYRVNHHGDGRIALWCSAPAGMQSLFIETSPEIYFRPPYVGHLGWVGIRLDREVTWADISGIMEDAYLNRAPKKYREMIKKD